MVGWHHLLNGHEFEQTPGYSEGQGRHAAVHEVAKNWTRPNSWTTRKIGFTTLNLPPSLIFICAPNPWSLVEMRWDIYNTCFLAIIFYVLKLTRIVVSGFLLGHKKYVLYFDSVNISSVQFSCSVVSDSLRRHEPQHARPPCPSPTPGVMDWLMSIKSVMPSSHLILCRPLLLLPSIPPSISDYTHKQIKVS